MALDVAWRTCYNFGDMAGGNHYFLLSAICDSHNAYLVCVQAIS